MKLSSDVFDDLLTIYLAGEASPGTRALVEERARDDEAFASRLARAGGLELAAGGPPLPADAELAALKRTRECIRLRTMFTAAAILFTLVPLVFVFDSAGARFLILGHYDGLVWASWSLAAASWAAWWVMHRAVAKAGL